MTDGPGGDSPYRTTTSPPLHREALVRLGVEREVDPVALRSLETRAAELRIKLPASFVEWCSMRGGTDLLRRITYEADPIEFERLGEPLQWRWEDGRFKLKMIRASG